MSDNLFYTSALIFWFWLLCAITYVVISVPLRRQPVYFFAIHCQPDCIEETDWKAVIKKCVQVSL